VIPNHSTIKTLHIDGGSRVVEDEGSRVGGLEFGVKV
jgi:hypothetical protein